MSISEKNIKNIKFVLVSLRHIEMINHSFNTTINIYTQAQTTVINITLD